MYSTALLQDLGFAVFLAKGGDLYAKLLKSPYGTIEMQLEYEVRMMGMNHAQAGHILAKRLELPELFSDVIARHHHECGGGMTSLTDFETDVIQLTALLPHAIQYWKPHDIRRWKRA